MFTPISRAPTNINSVINHINSDDVTEIISTHAASKQKKKKDPNDKRREEGARPLFFSLQ